MTFGVKLPEKKKPESNGAAEAGPTMIRTTAPMAWAEPPVAPLFDENDSNWRSLCWHVRTFSRVHSIGWLVMVSLAIFGVAVRLEHIRRMQHYETRQMRFYDRQFHQQQNQQLGHEVYDENIEKKRIMATMTTEEEANGKDTTEIENRSDWDSDERYEDHGHHEHHEHHGHRGHYGHHEEERGEHGDGPEAELTMGSLKMVGSSYLNPHLAALHGSWHEYTRLRERGCHQWHSLFWWCLAALALALNLRGIGKSQWLYLVPFLTMHGALLLINAVVVFFLTAFSFHHSFLFPWALFAFACCVWNVYVLHVTVKCCMFLKARKKAMTGGNISAFGQPTSVMYA